MKHPDQKRVHAQGLGFLLGFSALGALLNYLNTLETAFTAQEPPQWVMVIFWAGILLFYVPIFWVFVHSVRRWDWSLDEWGFGLGGRTWLAIGLSFLILVFIWLPVSLLERSGGILGNLAQLRELVSQAGFPLLLFEGYARTAEELLYRGFALVLFQRMFSQSRSKKLWAVLASSALFAVVHTHKEIPQIIQLFLTTSIPLAAFTIWTRSISLAMVFHALSGGGHIGALVAAIFFCGVALFNVRKKKLAQQPMNASPASLS